MSSVLLALSVIALLQHLGSLVPELAKECSAHKLGTMADHLARLIRMRFLDAVFLAIFVESLRPKLMHQCTASMVLFVQF